MRIRFLPLLLLAVCASALLLATCGPAPAPVATETPVVQINVVTATPGVTLAATALAHPYCGEEQSCAEATTPKT